MFEDPILIGISIACFAIVALFGIWRLVRWRWPRKTAGAPRAVVTAAAPGVGRRLDRNFESLVYGTGVPLSAGQVLGLVAMVALAMTTLFFFWWNDLWAAVAGLVLGLALPLVILTLFWGRRFRQIQGQLPDALSFIARSLRAGVSLEQSLTRAGEQMDEPIAGEFRYSAGQIQLGLHPQVALQNTATRIGLLDFNVFVSTVALYYQSGGNLALLLDRLAVTARDRNQFVGYFRAATALGRTAAILLGAAVPCIVLAYVIAPPEYLGDFFRSFAGWQLLSIVAVLELVGVSLTVYFLRVDY